jgi:hypothetical protein
MIETFIEKNKDWLNIYSIAARITGWTFIILSVMPLLCIPYMILGTIPTSAKTWHALVECLLVRLPLGVILLGVAQLAQYICENEYKPQWLLRHGTFLLYLFAALALVAPFASHEYMTRFTDNIEDYSTIMVLYVMPVFTRILVFIGLGKFLKQIMPVIEEAKSLV